jgi:hypothetical protein
MKMDELHLENQTLQQAGSGSQQYLKRCRDLSAGDGMQTLLTFRQRVSSGYIQWVLLSLMRSQPRCY